MTEIRDPDAATLEAVYNLNKHAKKYARLADENYRQGKGATAKANSVKKNALYGVKDAVLKEVIRHTEPDRIEQHRINGRDYWYLTLGEWSYHVPLDRTRTDLNHKEGYRYHGPWRRLLGLLDDPDADPRSIEDFESTEQKEHSDRSLKACLLHLEACGINANDHLDQTHVSYGRNSHFVGWKYLGDGGERFDADRDADDGDGEQEAIEA